MNIGDAIKYRRKSLALSQEELAKISGISQSYLSLIEKNKKEPNLAKLKVISDSLDIPLAFLLVKSLDENDLNKPHQDVFNGIKASLNALIDSILGDENKLA